MSKIDFNSTFEYKLIYVFRINDKTHKDHVKIGEATLHTDKDYTQFPPNCHELNYAARQRIDSYTITVGIVYQLLYTEIAVFEKNGKRKAFRDYKVHDVLKRSGINPKKFEFNKKPSEWYPCDLNTAINAIKAVKDGKTSLNASEISYNKNPIIFRPEQNEAIKKTISRFKIDTKMLWNAKMRFGKTLTALQVAKEMNFKRTIIITHRPVVSKGWFEDFEKIFYDKPNYYFGSRSVGKTLSDLLQSDNNFVYFASMQDLRGSDLVGGNFDKNDDIFKINWDFVVVDEAHEGTKTQLGKNVLEAVIKPNNEYKTYVLELSGTPFNLLTDFEKESIYTWDYIMEQEAKEQWDLNHIGDSNPYEELPKMNIFTYHLEKSLPVYIDVIDKAFNFREFFRIWTGDIEKDGKKIPNNSYIGRFIHEQDVKTFLDLICRKSDITNYPYSTDEYQDYFRHSLWVVPGVKEAKALEKLINKHHTLKYFEVVNVAGDGGEEIDTTDALKALKEKMTDYPENTRTITLSCGRLTTGVTVPEWTAVLMLAGTYSTAASQYLQTIFRVQSPANINGKLKTECFVFDFAPDRTLKMIAESVQLSARAGANNSVAELSLKKFLNYCPVIAIQDSNMKEYKVSELLQELKKAYAERVARNGFDDPKIYNDKLLKLTEIELKQFENLKKIVGATKQAKKTGEIDINKEGFDEEETQEEKKLKDKKKKQELTDEEKKRLAELKEKRKNRDSAISILRAISIRMPLLVYGMNIDIETDVTIDNFADLVDDISWSEFMPTGVDKTLFKQFSKYYDKDIFIAASRRIRYIAKTADELEPTERVKKIASLFTSFKNPDKETVLTPWRVVNMHMSHTIGGYDFFDEVHENILEEPRFIEKDDVTENVFNKNSKILEINSKTGLYPLYVTYALYRDAIKDFNEPSFEKKVELWDKVIKEQVFVICKTPMSKLITKRTLLGYRSGKTNMHTFDDLIMQLKDKQAQFIQKITKPSFWNLGGNGKMKFNAVVGNPPYQIILDGNKMSLNVYHEFIKTAVQINPEYISLITPSKWMGGELGPYKEMKGFFDFFTKREHLKLIHDYASSLDIFSAVDIKGGVSYFLYDTNNTTNLTYVLHEKGNTYTDIRKINKDDTTIIRFPQLMSIISKVRSINKKGYMSEMVSSRNPYGFISDFFEKNNEKVEQFEEISPEHDVAVYGLLKGKRLIKYIARKDLIKDTGGFDKYKVFVPRANGSGAFGEKFSTPILGLPIQISTDTFLEIGPFETEKEAQACLNYLKTKFFRAMVGAKKTGVFNYKDAFQFVPIELFKDSNIDWDVSIEEIDEQLYKKYGLDENEVEFIKTKVQEMK